MMQDIVILGAGGFAREAAFVIEQINQQMPTWRILGFISANKEDVGQSTGKYQIVGVDDDLQKMQVAAVIGIGSPVINANLIARLKENANLHFPNLIYPGTVWDKERIQMGQGNIVCAANVFTTDITIGSFNVFNLNCTYGHDCVIDDFCVFNPGVNVSGGVYIESGCLIGTGASILQNITIGAGATVGAGAVVVRDVLPHTTVVGVPAKPLRR